MLSGGQSVRTTVNHSTSQSISQPVSQSVRQSVSRPVRQLVSRSVGQSVSQSVSQLVSQSDSLPAIHQPVRLPTSPSVSLWKSQSTSQLISWSVIQSNIHSFSQPALTARQPGILGLQFISHVFLSWTVNESEKWPSCLLQAFYFVSIVVFAYASAFVLAVCVEFPTMQLEKVLFFRNKNSGI